MERRSAVVAKELEKIGVDVAALQETRLEGSGMIKEKEFSIFWSGVEAGERRQAGVSLAVRNDVLKKMNTLPKAISDRTIVMRLPLSNNKFATITYAPTTYPEPEKEEHYRSLSDVVGRVPAADKLVILGDFNARVGSDHELYRPALGKFGKGSCNSNGELLLNFCMQFGLVVTNSQIADKNIRIATNQGSRRKME
jgi:exonuclease III